MSQIAPYKIEVPEERLVKLKQKLQLVDFPEELEDAQWTYGAPLYLHLHFPLPLFSHQNL